MYLTLQKLVLVQQNSMVVTVASYYFTDLAGFFNYGIYHNTRIVISTYFLSWYRQITILVSKSNPFIYFGIENTILVFSRKHHLSNNQQTIFGGDSSGPSLHRMLVPSSFRTVRFVRFCSNLLGPPVGRLCIRRIISFSFF